MVRQFDVARDVFDKRRSDPLFAFVTTAEGNYVVIDPPMEADWFYQSFCSAHLEQKYQWGDGIGLVDDIYFTNEEWIDYVEGSKFVGIGVS
jgi:hypothetical protein